MNIYIITASTYVYCLTAIGSWSFFSCLLSLELCCPVPIYTYNQLLLVTSSQTLLHNVEQCCKSLFLLVISCIIPCTAKHLMNHPHMCTTVTVIELIYTMDLQGKLLAVNLSQSGGRDAGPNQAYTHGFHHSKCGTIA